MVCTFAPTGKHLLATVCQETETGHQFLTHATEEPI